MEADFGGYATKANLKCSDGRTIQPDAFAHMDGDKVPLVWQHTHNEPTNVLGHGVLEARDGDVYVHGYFNDTDKAQSAKALVQHGDITALSIYANKLVEKNKAVMHGTIREVSLVLSGANPGALIDNVNIVHGDGSSDALYDEAVIYTGLELTHSEEESSMGYTDQEKTIEEVFNSLNEEQEAVVRHMLGEALAHADEAAPSASASTAATSGGDDDDRTVKEIFDGMTEEEKNVVYFMIGQALEDAATKSGSSTEGGDAAAEHSATNKGYSTMVHNVFEQGELTHTDTSPALSHGDQVSIFQAANKTGSLQEAVEAFALQHGIQDIDVMFPDAKAVSNTPEWLARRTEWVAEVMSATRKTPFSRIKSLMANLTLDDARAKGYVKGTLKKEEFFKVSRRVTIPQTIYKKQKLDRDDILDITDFDVVAWLKGEMRLMLEEEVARAVLIGDGRSAEDEDKISEENVRPIATDDDLYVTYINIHTGGEDYNAEEIIDQLTLNRRHYRGSGNPTFFTSETILASLLLIKDKMGRRIYPTVNDLQAALRVQKIVAVELMDEPAIDVIGIIVNLQDYTIGADKGGDVSLFDDFDIDYNQYKYLIETRMSGALVKPKAALVVKAVRGATSQLVTPLDPAFNSSTKQVTVPTVTGVRYTNKKTGATLVTATPVAVDPDAGLEVLAVPSSAAYHFAGSNSDEWLFDDEAGLIEGPA